MPHRVAGTTIWMCGDCWVTKSPTDKVAIALTERKDIPREA